MCGIATLLRSFRNWAGSVVVKSIRASLTIDMTGMWPQPASTKAKATRVKRAGKRTMGSQNQHLLIHVYLNVTI